MPEATGRVIFRSSTRTVLEESKWSIGEVKKDKAEIVIRYKKSGQDAILKMFRKGGAWKVGIEETFATRRQK